MPSGKSFWGRPAPARSGGCDVAITADTLRRAAAQATEAAALAQDDLNAADGKIGDGDTGVMLRRLFEAVVATIPDQETDIGGVFQACAKACASGTGSSLGTLVTVAMMTLAKATKARSEIGWDKLAPLLASVRDQMMAWGGASSVTRPSSTLTTQSPLRSLTRGRAKATLHPP